MDYAKSVNRSANDRIAEVDKDLSIPRLGWSDLATAQIQSNLAVARAIQELTEALYSKPVGL